MRRAVLEAVAGPGAGVVVGAGTATTGGWRLVSAFETDDSGDPSSVMMESASLDCAVTAPASDSQAWRTGVDTT